MGPGAFVGAAGLATAAGLHVAWGLGSPWPMATPEELADVVAGNDRVPDPAACFVVAGALGIAAARLLGMPLPSERFRRLDRQWYRPLCLGLALCSARAAR